MLGSPHQVLRSVHQVLIKKHLALEQHFGRYVVPDDDTSYTTLFEEIGRQTVPFITNFRGVVYEITGTTTNTNGDKILAFTIQDVKGDVMKVYALGRYAEVPVIQESNDIIVYFASAKDRSRANPSATFWIYSDAYVHVFATQKVLRSVRQEITLKET